MADDKAVRAGDALEKRLARKLDGVYSDALKKALKNQSSFLQKVKDVESGKKLPPSWYTPEQAVKWRQGYIRELLRQGKVIERIAADIAAAGEEAAPLIKEAQTQVYAINRAYTVDYITSKVDAAISFQGYSKEQLGILLQEQETPFSKIAYKNLGNDRLVVRRLNSEMAQAVMLGESQKDIIKRIRKVTGQSAYQARRVAQTERTRVQSQARADTLHEATGMGLKVTKRWSTRMRNSRDSHIALNGVIVPENKPFVSGAGNHLMYPGDPSAPAEDVINCHCVMVPDVEV